MGNGLERTFVLRCPREGGVIQRAHLPAFGSLEPFESLDYGGASVWKVGSRAGEIVRGHVELLREDLHGVEARVPGCSVFEVLNSGGIDSRNPSEVAAAQSLDRANSCQTIASKRHGFGSTEPILCSNSRLLKINKSLILSNRRCSLVRAEIEAADDGMVAEEVCPRGCLRTESSKNGRGA